MTNEQSINSFTGQHKIFHLEYSKGLGYRHIENWSDVPDIVQRMKDEIEKLLNEMGDELIFKKSTMVKKRFLKRIEPIDFS